MTQLGEKLGAGRAAEVFAYGEGRVIKLLFPGGSQTGLEREAAAQRAAHAAGVPVPEVICLETIDGRAGLVMARIAGLDGLTAIERKPWRLWSIGRQIGRVHRELGRSEAPPELVRLRETIRHEIETSPAIPDAARVRLVGLLEPLPDGNALCHLDFHPGNVLESSAGPVVIDFSAARAGEPLADYAKSLVILEAGVLPAGASRWELALVKLGRRLMGKAYRSGYMAAGKVDNAKLERWRTVMIGQRLAQGIPEERPQLLRMLSRSLRELS